MAISQAPSRNILIFGDFNSILHPSERVGSSDFIPSADINAFKLFVDSNHLIDVGLSGRRFTWYRSNGSCKSRIDRALINVSWVETWSDTGLRGLPRSFSDHCPLILQSTLSDRGPKPFRFINAWMTHPDFIEVVRNSWNKTGIQGWGGFIFKEKLKRLKQDLKIWNADVFGRLDQSILDLRQEIHLLDSKDDSLGLSSDEAASRQAAVARLLLNLSRKCDLLSQKARVRLLKEGDINSSFFHKCINKRRVQNALIGLSIDGSWCEEPSPIKSAVKNHFSRIFSPCSTSGFSLPDDLFTSRLNPQDGDFLTRSFSEDEIKSAVWDCDSGKCPGPDGFNFEFYRRCWDIIKDDLILVFNEFHSNGKLVKGCNPSFIALIPKKEDCSSLDSFRPISLIGSLYKIIAKVLAIRLKSVLGKIIGDTQSAFLPGRFILDGAVALNEAIEDARKSKVKRLFLKIDLAKAFDSISWDYLLDVKRMLNFPTKWIAWISECLLTAKANVLVNGSPSGEFDLHRGVRQGDPLSPFLFLIAAEGLSALTHRAVARGVLQASSIGRHNVVISHLQYADDTIFIVHGDATNAKALRLLLKNFEAVSGLSVNFNKCSAYGINLSDDELRASAAEFGCQVGNFPLPYLGLKVGGNLRSLDCWQEVLRKIERKIKKWDVHKLSMAGRSTLINSVLSSTPIYTLSFMPLPKKVAREIDRLFRDFLWGNQGESKKIAWIKWDDLILPKKEGGLGFLNLHSFNRALLCKWVWRFLSPEDSLWKRLIASRHGDPPWPIFSHSTSRLRMPQSGWWRRISSLVVGEKGRWFWELIIRRLGDGKSTNFWNDVWLGSSSLRTQFPRLFHLSANQDASVNDMGRWSNGAWTWDISWRRELRDTERATAANFIDHLTKGPTSTSLPDKWEWHHKPANISIVRHIYSNLEARRRPQLHTSLPPNILRIIWSSSAPFKAQLHGWRLCRNRLPTIDNLRSRIDMPGVDPLCCFCRANEETAVHLFLECPTVRKVWANFISWIGYSWAPPATILDHFLCFASLQPGKLPSRIFGGLWICIVWVWWKWRNAIVFEKKEWNILKIMDEIKCRYWSWCVVRGRADSRITFEAWKHSPLFLM